MPVPLNVIAAHRTGAPVDSAIALTAVFLAGGSRRRGVSCGDCPPGLYSPMPRRWPCTAPSS